MLGAIAGDIIGSVYEHHPIKTRDFPLFGPGSRFTDDTVLTVAVAEAILTGRPYGEVAHEFGRRYPDAGYGRAFLGWLASDAPAPYGSWGNGSAMRASPIGWAFDTVERALAEAKKAAACSHDHPEGIAGSQSVALAVFLARRGATKAEIGKEISGRFGYDLDRTLDHIRPCYRFHVRCALSVPEAFLAFLESTSWEDAVRNAVSLGGDADTQAAIAGSVAEAFYGSGSIPAGIRSEVERQLPPDLLAVLERFNGTLGSTV